MVKLENGGESYEIHPHVMGVEEIHAKIPVKKGYLQIDVVDGKAVTTVVEE